MSGKTELGSVKAPKVYGETRLRPQSDRESFDTRDKSLPHSPIPKPLEQIADVVLAYRPKSKQPKPRKRKKAKRGAKN